MHAKSESPVGLALVEESVALDPESSEGWYNLGVYEAERGRLERALECYERTEPLHDGALGNGCELLRRFDRFEEALTWADRVLARGKDSWSPHLNRAVCLFHLHRWEEAEADYRAAQRLAPDRPIVWWETFPLYP